MKVGSLVKKSYISKHGVGILLEKKKTLIGKWVYRVIWPDGSIVFHTRGTLEVINEKR